MGPTPTDHYDPESLWWRHERLHRAVLKDYEAGMGLIAAERDGLEARFVARMEGLMGTGPDAQTAAVAACWREAAEAEARWTNLVGAGRWDGSSYGRSWARLEAVAGVRTPVSGEKSGSD